MLGQKIRKTRDLANPVLLRRCNKKYKECLLLFNRRDWVGAISLYTTYINEFNEIDYDAYYERGVSYFELAQKKKTELKNIDNPKIRNEIEKEIENYYDKSIEDITTAKKYEPMSRILQNKLAQLFLIKKNQRKFCDIIKELATANTAEVLGKIKLGTKKEILFVEEQKDHSDAEIKARINNAKEWVEKFNAQK